nr:ABC transporter ATP-binding protein [Bacteroides faecium]
MMNERMKKKSGVARLFEIAGEKKGLLVLAGILSAASALCMLVPYWSVYQVLRELLLHGSKISELDSGILVHWGWVAFSGLVGGLLLLYASLMASHVAAFRILYGLRIRLSEHIGRLSLGYLNGTATGTIKKIMEQNIEKIENFVAHTIPDLVNVLATVVLMFIIFFSLNGWMAVICVVCIALSIGLQFMNFFGKNAKEFTKIYYDTQERMSASAVQYVRGMPVVKIFGQSVRSFRRFNAEIEAYKSYALRVCDTYLPAMVAFTVLLNSLITFILPTGLLLLSREPQNIGLAAIYLFFIIMGPGVASPIYKLMYLGSSTNEIDEGVKRIDRIFDEQPLAEPEISHLPSSYDIEFRHVSFAYENKAEATRTEALKDLSFTARQGEITALVGPSGSGKSTVANLIPRFWDVNEGEIRIGGANIKQIANGDLMSLVSFVFQDNFLFFDTLYENIRVGDASATREQVIEAARAAQCHEFIENLPAGYDTRIGDKGVYLSGGEAQRICVARAILKNAPILVLDEATAFADPENEYKMQQAIQQLIRNKTVIIIAHRLSSIISAEQILVLKEGKLVQSGRHEVLSTTEGVYKKMWDAYTSAFRWQLTIKKEEVK